MATTAAPLCTKTNENDDLENACLAANPSHEETCLVKDEDTGRSAIEEGECCQMDDQDAQPMHHQQDNGLSLQRESLLSKSSDPQGDLHQACRGPTKRKTKGAHLVGENGSLPTQSRVDRIASTCEGEAAILTPCHEGVDLVGQSPTKNHVFSMHPDESACWSLPHCSSSCRAGSKGGEASYLMVDSREGASFASSPTTSSRKIVPIITPMHELSLLGFPGWSSSRHKKHNHTKWEDDHDSENASNQGIQGDNDDEQSSVIQQHRYEDDNDEKAIVVFHGDHSVSALTDPTMNPFYLDVNNMVWMSAAAIHTAPEHQRPATSWSSCFRLFARKSRSPPFSPSPNMGRKRRSNNGTLSFASQNVLGFAATVDHPQSDEHAPQQPMGEHVEQAAFHPSHTSDNSNEEDEGSQVTKPFCSDRETKARLAVVFVFITIFIPMIVGVSIELTKKASSALGINNVTAPSNVPIATIQPMNTPFSLPSSSPPSTVITAAPSDAPTIASEAPTTQVPTFSPTAIAVNITHCLPVKYSFAFEEVRDDPFVFLAEYQTIATRLRALNINGFDDPSPSTTGGDQCSAQNLAVWWMASQAETTQQLGDKTTLVNRYVLAVMYLGLYGNHWKNQTLWMTQESTCGWAGITCQAQNGTHHTPIVGINMYRASLYGTIPSELTYLNHLVRLNLADNTLFGSIPTGLFGLQNLEYLDVSKNRLAGTLPTNIGALTSLRDFFMDQNDYHGSIPTEIGHLANLTERFSLWKNDFSGSIPTEIGRLTRVDIFDLGSNSVTGSIPTEIGNLSNLRLLFLDHNHLVDSIPSELGSLVRLESINLGANQLTGKIPSELGSVASDLELFFVEENRLVGSLPQGILGCTALRTLDAGKNALTGSLPSEIERLTSLKIVEVSFNRITGSLPTQLVLLPNLKAFHAKVNQLTGPLPCFMQSPRLDKLEISWNALTGTLCTEMGLLPRLEHIDLSKNNMNGTLPKELMTLPMLVLSLSMNSFTGSIPSEIGLQHRIGTLKLADNVFTGTIPTQVGRLQNLIEFDVRHNRLDGTIPSEIGTINSWLYFLKLSNNRLSGTLPREISRLERLWSFLLDGNQDISGTIPTEYGRLRILQTLTLNQTSITGEVPPEVCRLRRSELETLLVDCDEVLCSCCDNNIECGSNAGTDGGTSDGRGGGRGSG